VDIDEEIQDDKVKIQEDILQIEKLKLSQMKHKMKTKEQLKHKILSLRKTKAKILEDLAGERQKLGEVIEQVKALTEKEKAINTNVKDLIAQHNTTNAQIAAVEGKLAKFPSSKKV
jgi:chromosome segregation ATPase